MPCRLVQYSLEINLHMTSKYFQRFLFFLFFLSFSLLNQLESAIRYMHGIADAKCTRCAHGRKLSAYSHWIVLSTFPCRAGVFAKLGYLFCVHLSKFLVRLTAMQTGEWEIETKSTATCLFRIFSLFVCFCQCCAECWTQNPHTHTQRVNGKWQIS